MDKELKAAGKKVQMTILNHHYYLSSVHNQTKRCDFPVWQDTTGKNAWGAMQGGKEYYYVYDKKGALNGWWLPYGSDAIRVDGGPNSPGYKKLKALIESLQ